MEIIGERDRLRAENAELVEALRETERSLKTFAQRIDAPQYVKGCLQKIRAVIARLETK